MIECIQKDTTCTLKASQIVKLIMALHFDYTYFSISFSRYNSSGIIQYFTLIEMHNVMYE